MNKKALQLVTFEQAKKLKELGFDLKVKNFYTTSGMLLDFGKKIDFNNSVINIFSGEYKKSKGSICFSAPDIITSVEWLFKKMGIIE